MKTLAILLITATTLAGCIVVPHGHGGRGHGGYGYAQPSHHHGGHYSGHHGSRYRHYR
ncbi:hypothetical protein [Bordetella tumulicola]|uniref:hypothetical protein n=1 Tax=Bordetella tumulicola TaxID=1649133 RepID=UPI0039EF7282